MTVTRGPGAIVLKKQRSGDLGKFDAESSKLGSLPSRSIGMCDGTTMLRPSIEGRTHMTCHRPITVRTCCYFCTVVLAVSIILGW